MKIELIKGDITKVEAAEIAIQNIVNNEISSIEKILFVCFDEDNFNIYKTILSSR